MRSVCVEEYKCGSVLLDRSLWLDFVSWMPVRTVVFLIFNTQVEASDQRFLSDPIISEAELSRNKSN